MSAIEDKLSHLDWTIAGRSSNLQSSLKLLGLFYKYEDLWKTKKLSRAAQDLTAVSFSLWRSAFLAEKSGRRGVVFTDGRKFLERVIEDNAIGYTNDKDAREWSFNYYTRNARASLEILHSYWPELSGPYEGKKRNSKERWDYCYGLFDQTVDKFDAYLKAETDRSEKTKEKQDMRAGAKVRRAASRRFTLTGSVDEADPEMK